MTIEPQKKNVLIFILKILFEETDDEHRLSATEIKEILLSKYNLNVDRKTVKANLITLLDLDYNIEYETAIRNNSGGREEIFYDWHFVHDFDESELRLLIDSLIFSSHIPENQCKDLIDKLTTLTSKHFNSHIKHRCLIPNDIQRSEGYFSVIDFLDEAIANERQVSFNYTYYDIDKKEKLRRDENGKEISYVINPYQMVAANNHYYLICNHDEYDTVGNYRVDRIRNIKLLDKQARPVKSLPEYKNGLYLPKHMAEHIYMFSGESIHVKFRIQRTYLSTVVDWFGLSFDIDRIEGDDESVDISVYVNEKAMHYWALQYGTIAEVIAPKSLRDKISETIKTMGEKYS